LAIPDGGEPEAVLKATQEHREGKPKKGKILNSDRNGKPRSSMKVEKET